MDTRDREYMKMERPRSCYIAYNFTARKNTCGQAAAPRPTFRYNILKE